MQIKELAEVVGATFRWAGVFFETALTVFPVFSTDQKVHYNALFAEIRPKHAL
jgi:hypothetical protein